MNDKDYAREALTHNLNYLLIGLFVILMILTSTFWGWFIFLGIAEAGVWMLSFTDIVRRYLYFQNCLLTKEGMLQEEDRIYNSINNPHKKELQGIRDLCGRIEAELSRSVRRTSTSLLEKMIEVRYKFAKLIELHYVLSQTSEDNTTTAGLKNAIAENKTLLERETNSKVRSTISVTIDIQKKRLERLQALSGRVRDTEARLNLLKNSLELLFDDMRSSGDSDDTESMVDGLVASLDLGELQDISTIELADLRLPAQQQLNASRRTKELVYEKRR